MTKLLLTLFAMASLLGCQEGNLMASEFKLTSSQREELVFNELYVKDTVATAKAVDGTNVNVLVRFASSPAFDGAFHPVRDNKTNNNIVALGFHSENLLWAFNSNFTQQYNLSTGNYVPMGNLRTGTRLWPSPNNPDVSKRDHQHWAAGAFTPDTGKSWVAIAHSEVYMNSPMSTMYGYTVDSNLNITGKKLVYSKGVLNTDKRKTKNIDPYGNYQGVFDSYLGDNNGLGIGWYDRNGTVGQKGTWEPGPVVGNAPNQHWDPYDLTLFDLPGGLNPNPAGIAVKDRMVRKSIIIQAPPFTPEIGKPLVGTWTDASGNTFTCPGLTEPAQINASMGQWELSNLAEYTENGITYAVMFSGQHPVSMMGFPLCGQGYYYNYRYNYTDANGVNYNNDSKPKALKTDNPLTTNVTIDPNRQTFGPLLLRVPKNQIRDRRKWEVFGFGMNNKTEPKWLSLNGIATVEQGMMISPTNIRPYIFFKNLQPALSNCKIEGDLTSCERYNPYVNHSMGAALRVMGNKLVQLGAQSNGKVYLSYTTSLANPLELEQTYLQLKRADNTDIPKLGSSIAYTTKDVTLTDFRMDTGRYLSFFDPKSTSLNLNDFVQNSDGSYSGLIMIAFRGNGGLTKTQSPGNQPRLSQFPFVVKF